MNRKICEKFLLLFALFFALFNQIQAQIETASQKTQNPQTCSVSKNIGGKYKFVFGETSVVEGRKIFFLTVKIKPEKFTKEYLLLVAQRVRETYCNEDKINTVILDSSDNRKFDDLTPPPVFPPAAKALYSLGKTEGRELIQFISSSKVTGEIKIK